MRTLVFQLHVLTIRYLYPNLPSHAYLYLSTCVFIFYVCAYLNTQYLCLKI